MFKALLNISVELGGGSYSMYTQSSRQGNAKQLHMKTEYFYRSCLRGGLESVTYCNLCRCSTS